MAFFQIQITTVFSIKGEKKGKGERKREVSPMSFQATEQGTKSPQIQEAQ